MKQLISQFSLLSLIAILIQGCTESDEQATPEHRKLTESVYASANVVPANLYKVFPEAVGTLDEVLIDEGDTVFAGQQLATISSDQPAINAANAKLRKELSEANISSSASAITRIRQELETATEQLELDSLNYTRQQRLAAKDIGSETELENRKLKYQSSKNRVASLRSQLSETERELTSALKLSRNDWNIALSRLEDYIIRSKMTGKVYAVNAEAGELVSTQQVFALIGARDEFIIELMIDEVDIARVQTKQHVMLTLDAYEDKVFEAKISKIYPTKEERTQTFRVEATFSTKPENLYNGLSGEANIIISEAENALTIPLEYLSTESTVKTKSGDKIEVKTGRQNMELVEVLDGLDSTMVLVKP